MAAAPAGWVIDGNYDSKLDGLVVAAADTVIWLDLPCSHKLWRLWWRTLHRINNNVELWNGNRETWRGAFLSRDSLFLWMVKTHRRHRQEWPARFGGDPRLVRLRSARAARHWLTEQSEASAVARGELTSADPLAQRRAQE
jgi:hypothetical protein